MFTIKRNHKSISEIFEKYMSSEYEDIDFVFDLVDYYRKKYTKKTTRIDVDELISEVRTAPEKANFLRQKLIFVFSNKGKTRLLTDAGLLSSVSFFKELRRRLAHQLIPDQPSQENIQYVLNQIFYKASDADWLRLIPIESWYELFDILSIKTFYDDARNKTVSKQILLAIMILSQRMGGFALQTDVLRMVPEYSSLNSPFIALDDEINSLHRTIIAEGKAYLDMREHQLDYKQLNILADQCENFVEQAVNNTSKYGVSFSVNQTLLLIRQQVRRIRKLYNFLFINNEEEEKKRKTVEFYLKLVKINSKKNNVRKLIDDSVYNITYEITNYTGKTGEHYITASSKEYFKMLKTALWGGFIVAFLCLFKIHLSKIHSSEFIYALNYSLNYAIGFTTIYLTGSTLATKQPAMTASTIAKTLENIGVQNQKEKDRQYSEFGALFTRLFRSQFIAFIGNVFGAFPVSMLLIFASVYFFNYNFAESKSATLLAELDIRQTPVFFHACIAGVFLFLSGIIAGNVASVNNFTNFYYRLSEHPILKSVVGKEKMLKLSNWMRKKWPGIVSNIWFGFFMGSAGVIGTFLGLPIDIRHITFASGNFAYGLFGAHFDVALDLVIWCIIGIGLIGFGNFIVSFSLSLGIALRSREIPLSELKNLAKSVWLQFKKQPMAFFLPVKTKE